MPKTMRDYLEMRERADRVHAEYRRVLEDLEVQWAEREAARVAEKREG